MGDKIEKKTGSLCTGCGGAVVEVLEEVWNKQTPSNKWMKTGEKRSHGFHCRVCGIMYRFPPPKDLLKAKSET
ncbi:hypothetical protein KJ603_01110 [Patescibacteria group bacterium]|nr:hypothetical protein [Patescibacteria group bacterium]